MQSGFNKGSSHMAEVVLEMSHVRKKFRRGEIHDSLRDLIPALVGRIFSANRSNGLQGNEFWALDDVSFKVNKGEALGIIGANGAGKSTILKLLCGIMRPTKGAVKVNGALSALIEVGAGFHPDLTGRENIFLNGAILGMKKDQIRRKFDEIVEFSGIADFIDTPVKRYSSGMYARLGFSVAAHVEPDILVVDEVLSVGDYAFQNKCVEKMKSILRQNATVIFVSHNLRAVAEMCRSCILLNQGKITREGTAEEVVNAFLNPAPGNNDPDAAKQVVITNTVLRSNAGQVLQFSTGDRMFFDTDIVANACLQKLSLSIIIFDESNNRIFDTSTERLYHDSFSLDAGERLRITFELDLHLAAGAYRIGAYVYSYAVERMYDMRVPAATFYVKSSVDFKGVVNLYPKASISALDGNLLMAADGSHGCA